MSRHAVRTLCTLTLALGLGAGCDDDGGAAPAQSAADASPAVADTGATQPLDAGEALDAAPPPDPSQDASLNAEADAEIDAEIDAEADAQIEVDAEPLYPPAPPYAEALAAQPRTPPPPPSYSGQSCPQITAAHDVEAAYNEAFATGDQQRQFRVILPSDYDPQRAYPLVFAWHWLAGDSRQMVREGGISEAADQVGFITVVFDRLLSERGNNMYLLSWPFAEDHGKEGEYLFFNDVFACMTEQFNIDLERVYGVGVSAGALWLTHLMNTPIIDHFAAVEILSGGLGQQGSALIMRHEPRAHRFPAFVLWGGPRDRLVLDFEAASLRLLDALTAHHHFVTQCTHSSGHNLPPVTTVEGEPRFRMLWRFLLDHPYGLDPGASPYHETGLPEEFEAWCRIGTPPPPAAE